MSRQVPKSAVAVTLDAAGTMFELAESVGDTYARIAKRYGVVASPEAVDRGFRATWKRTSRPHASGPEDEVAWWRAVAFGAFSEAGAVGLDESTFDPLYDALFREYEKPEAWRVYLDTLPFLEKCRERGIRVAALSNFDERLVTILDGLGLAEHFEVIVTSAGAKASKPDRHIFDHTSSLLGLSPQEILHIGDEPEADWEGARAAGFQVYELNRSNGSGLLGALE